MCCYYIPLPGWGEGPLRTRPQKGHSVRRDVGAGLGPEPEGNFVYAAAGQVGQEPAAVAPDGLVRLACPVTPSRMEREYALGLDDRFRPRLNELLQRVECHPGLALAALGLREALAVLLLRDGRDEAPV